MNKAQSEQLPCMYLCYIQTWPWQSHIRPPARLPTRQEHRLCQSLSILSNYCVSEDRTLKELTTSLSTPTQRCCCLHGLLPKTASHPVTSEGCPPPHQTSGSSQVIHTHAEGRAHPSQVRAHGAHGTTTPPRRCPRCPVPQPGIDSQCKSSSPRPQTCNRFKSTNPAPRQTSLTGTSAQHGHQGPKH